jgi:glycosyltransferase involved in cell wall biosynthesis
MKECLILFMNSLHRNDVIPTLPEYYEWKVLDEKTFSFSKSENFKTFSKLYKTLKPQAFYTYKDNVGVFSEILVQYFELRKRWLHLDSFDDFSVDVHVAPNIFGSVGFHGHKYSFENPIFSVITTTFHSKERLLRPLNSLRTQTYKNWEWIVFDDSKDDDHGLTFSQVQSMADEDFRIRPYKNPQHSGYIGEMKNFASSFARGEWIVELDHDDEIDSTLFQVILDATKKFPEADFVYCDSDEVFEDTGLSRSYGDFYAFGFGANQNYVRNNKWQIQCLTQGMNPRTVRHIIGVPNHVRVWRKSFYESIGKHNPILSVADDYELLLKTFLRARDRVRIPKPFYLQYVNTNGNNFTKIRNALIQHNSFHVYRKYASMLEEKLKEQGSVELPFEYQPYWLTQSYFPRLEQIFSPDQNDDTVSVIIPTYNRPIELKRALKSVLDQTYSNILIYIVGDKCPTLDDTMKEILVTLSETDAKKLFYWNLQDNSKKYGAVSRNYGLKMMATTQWIAYLDDDNYWLPNHVETLMDSIKNTNADFAFSSFLVDGKDELLCTRPCLGRIDSSSFLHKKSLAEKFGYWPMENVKYANDWEFVKPWTAPESKVVWAASKKCTLVYTTSNNFQTVESIRNLCKDE